MFSVWYLLANPINRVEIEFMPVYKPSPAEVADPALFAKNVQVEMANRLKVPATDITYAKFYEDYCRQHNALLNGEEKDNQMNGKKKKRS